MNSIKKVLIDQLLADTVHQLDQFTIQNFIDINNIKCLYHFTDRRNIDSIIRRGGLYSAYLCDKLGIVYKGGGDKSSRKRDRETGTENYVNLSFCNDHGMRPVAERRNQYESVLLEISPKILFKQGVLFSDVNATKKDAKIEQGGFGLSNVNYEETQKKWKGNYNCLHHAEILVPEKIPVDFIINLFDEDL